MFKWLLIGGAAVFILPKLLRAAADNPEALRTAAAATERAREKAIELGKRGVAKGREFVAERAAKKAVNGTFAGYTGRH
jgi:hypothetical protein